MARRKASSPKIPADTLARARAQAAMTPPPAEPASTPMSELRRPLRLRPFPRASA